VASKTVVELLDDLDGGRADETVSFSLDGVEYEIDLSTTHAKALRQVLAEFVTCAHRAQARQRRAKANKPDPNRPGPSMTAEIRRLAIESAKKVSEAQVPERQPMSTVVPMPIAKVQVESTEDDDQVPALIIPFQEAGL
jgi:hypothetical protein